MTTTTSRLPKPGQRNFRQKRETLLRLVEHPKDESARQRATKLFGDLGEALRLAAELREDSGLLAELRDGPKANTD